MCKSFNNEETLIAQELLVSFLGSSDNVVSPDTIEMQMNRNVIELPDDWHLRDRFVKETWIWKDPVPGHRYICAVDPSGGSSEDRTAIEIIDVDAIDEDGNPCYEQVLEYCGKRTGDEIGEMVYQYADSFNQALVVVECIGGYGDATVLTLQRMKYPNLYYEQPSLKTYTIERAYSKFNLDTTEQLPGFRNNGLRLQMIQNFVTMVKENSLRIRSMRVINEMETWVWKKGRPDHMDGMHDDTLTCLSMGVFVMLYYMLKSDRDKNKDMAIVKSWHVNNGGNTVMSKQLNYTMNISERKHFPFYSQRQMLQDRERKIKAMMLMGGFYTKKR